MPVIRTPIAVYAGATPIGDDSRRPELAPASPAEAGPAQPPEPVAQERDTVWAECVALMLLCNGAILAERRKLTKAVDPGAVAIPGGHVEAGESLAEALRREAVEELGIVPVEARYVCSLLHPAAEVQRIHYFVAQAWQGDIQSREAEAVLWLPLDASERFDLAVDRVAIGEYVRLFGQ